MKWLIFSICFLACSSWAEPPSVPTNYFVYPAGFVPNTNLPPYKPSTNAPAIVFWGGPTPFHRLLIQRSTNLIDWRDVTNAPEDGVLRTNRPAVLPQQYFRLLEYPVIITTNSGLTVTNK